MPHTPFLSVYIDKNENIYSCNDLGIYKHSGNKTTTYSAATSFRDAVVVHSDSLFWMASQKELITVKNGIADIQNIKSLLPISAIVQLGYENADCIWPMFHKTTAFCMNKGKLVNYHIPVNIFFNHDAGIQFFGSKSGYYTLNKNTFESYSSANGLPGNIINDIYIDSENKIFISTDQGVALYQDDTTT